REVMVRNGDAGKSVWVCEFGWNALPSGWSGDPSPWGSVSLDRQASYTVAAYQRMRREWPWMGVANVWLFQDPAPAPADPTQFFGLVGQDFQPRPVYTALANVMHLPPAAATGNHSAIEGSVTYDGAWQTVSAPSPSPSGMASPVSAATATLVFDGSAASVEVMRGPNFGIAYLSVDGSPTYATEVPKDDAGRAAVDLYAPSPAASRVAVAAGLPFGRHQLTLTVSGRQSPLSSGPAVQIEGFGVGLTKDQRTAYAGGILLGLGLVLLGWKTLAMTARRLARYSGGASQRLAALNGRLAALPGGLLVPLAALGVSLGLFYAGRPLPVALFGALLFAGAALWRPDLALVFVPLVAPFYLQPRHIGALDVPLSEAVIWLCIAAWLLRSAWRGEWAWPRSELMWPALLLFAAATASVFAADYPRYALREWRTDVLEPLLFFWLLLTVRPPLRPMLR